MVRHHVAQCAGLLVEATATLNTYGFGHCDLYVVDMVAVPEWLEDAIGKAQHQNILDRFFAEEVINSIDLTFGQYLEDLSIKGLCGSKVVSERFFDDYPSPRCFRLLSQPRMAELLDNRSKETLADRQIE